jgi:hypothetical protein
LHLRRREFSIVGTKLARQCVPTELDANASHIVQPFHQYVVGESAYKAGNATNKSLGNHTTTFLSCYGTDKRYSEAFSLSSFHAVLPGGTASAEAMNKLFIPDYLSGPIWSKYENAVRQGEDGACNFRFEGYLAKSCKVQGSAFKTALAEDRWRGPCIVFMRSCKDVTEIRFYRDATL